MGMFKDKNDVLGFLGMALSALAGTYLTNWWTDRTIKSEVAEQLQELVKNNDILVDSEVIE